MKLLKGYGKCKTALMVCLAVLICAGCGSRDEELAELVASGVPDFDQLAKEMDEKVSRESEEETNASQIEDLTTTDIETTEGGEPSDIVSTEGTTSLEVTTTETQKATEKNTEQQTTEQDKITEQNTTKANNTTVATTTEKPTSTTAKPTSTTTKPTSTTTKPTSTAATTTSEPPLLCKDGALKEFKVTSLDGVEYTQEIFSKADVNVVILWTTWCGYCKLEMPALQRVMESHSGQSVQFFNIVMNAETDYYKSYAQDLINQMAITFPCLIYNDTMSDGYIESISGYPTTLYLNREGELMHKIVGSYAANGEDYAVDVHNQFLDFFIQYPDYLPE